MLSCQVITIDISCLQKDSDSYQDLPPVLASILKQVIKGKLPQYMSLRGISAPFIQIYILRILQHLTLNNESKEILADILLDMINRCQVILSICNICRESWFLF